MNRFSISGIITAIFGVTTGIGLLRSGFLDPLADWAKSFVFDQIASAIWAMLPPQFATFFHTVSVSNVGQMVNDAAWFIPFWQIVVIYFTAIALGSLLLLLRYIIGWVPFIEG
jgi:hypothetical protein